MFCSSSPLFEFSRSREQSREQRISAESLKRIHISVVVLAVAFTARDARSAKRGIAVVSYCSPSICP